MSVSLLELFAVAFAGLDDPVRAAHMLGAATAMRDTLELPLDPPDAALLERGVGPARDRIDPDRWRADVEAGRHARGGRRTRRGAGALSRAMVEQ